MIACGVSDKASTQEKFNSLVKEARDRDQKLYNSEEMDSFVEAYCGLHLGVNLREAQAASTKEFFKEKYNGDEDSPTEVDADTLVREFSKLLGHLGTPEYAQGVRHFKEFIENLLEKAKQLNDNEENIDTLNNQLKTKLARQVGSRYFVTSRNAGRIFFLSDTARTFLGVLKDTKPDLNKLEKSVISRLEDTRQIGSLKLDGLLYDKVYADLMMLLKSNKLNNSVLDMNIYYLELRKYLELLCEKPRLILDSDYQVFSEKRLYDPSSKTNHRVNPAYIPVRKRLYDTDDYDTSILLPLTKHVTAAMLKKLNAYKQDQLPGGVLWNPDNSAKALLSKMPPTNDFMESTLALNDFLHGMVNNMSQLTRSTMVEVLKNETGQWFEKLQDNSRKEVISLAKKRKKQVIRHEEELSKKRKEKRRKAHEELVKKKEKSRQRLIEKKRQLCEVKLISTVTELNAKIKEVDEMTNLTSKQRENLKLTIIKEQVNIRRLLQGNKKFKIVYSHKKVQKPFRKIKDEFVNLLKEE